MNNITLSVVFLEGIASFISPCFLPLIPIYIGYISGEAAGRKSKWSVIVNAAAFVAGFTVVFILLGAAASTFGNLLADNKKILSKILGVFVIIMGLFYMGVIKSNILNMEKRFSLNKIETGVTGAFLLGASLVFGWSPCIGPILSNVMSIAADKAQLGYGIYLLFIYSMGIAVPFMVTAILMDRIYGKLRWILKYTNQIKIITGIILVATGLILLTGSFFQMENFLSRLNL